jgi:DNA (cytosine-5)-methyltransferase 1
MLKVLDLFSGIGGFSLGLQATNEFETIAFCEIDPFCQKVLKKHWPNVPIFNDITKLGEGELNGLGNIDVICGGFPCQDISCAGKGAGIHAARSGLWWEMLRIIRLVRPRYVLVENVAALLNRGLDEVLGSLAESGYDAEWTCLRASDVGAPHRRERVFLVAYSGSTRTRVEESNSSGQRRQYPDLIQSEMVRPEDRTAIAERIIAGREDVADSKSKQSLYIRKGSIDKTSTGRCGKDVANTMPKRLSFSETRSGEEKGTCPRLGDRGIFRREPTGTWPIESGFCRMVDGLPGRVDRLRALGNAIVPQCATYIGNCVLDYEKALNSNVSNI